MKIEDLELEKNGFHNGVWKDTEIKSKELENFPPMIGSISSILKAPIYVLNEKSAKKF